MANIKYTDADGSTRYSYSSKVGGSGTPDLSPETLHDDLVVIEGYVDGLETAIASTNTKLDTVHTDLGTIDGHVDGLETLVTSTNTKLDTVNTNLGTLLTTGTPITGQSLESGGAGGLGWLSSVRKKLSDLIALLPTALGTTTASGSFPVTLASDGTFATLAGAVTETAPASDTASSGLNGRLQRIAQRLTTVIAGIPLLAGESHIGEIGGNILYVATEFTRPSDTTAYAAGDVVSDSTSATTMQVLANAARVSGGSGYVTVLRIATDKKSITPRIRLHFFNTNGATLAADNVAYKESYSDSSKRLFYYDMPAMTTATDTTNSDMSRSLDVTVRLPYTCAATSLYYVCETLDAFTPASGQKITVTVGLDRN